MNSKDNCGYSESGVILKKERTSCIDLYFRTNTKCSFSSFMWIFIEKTLINFLYPSNCI